MKITVYNVICHKEYENDPDCNGSYAVTCTSKEQAEKELRKCIAEDYDGYYDGNDEQGEDELNDIVETAANEKLLVIGDMTCTYVIDKQKLTINA